jgi:hypothetical protein
MAYLVITTEGLQPCRHELNETLTIGRAFDCEISIADESLSRRHCRIEPADRAGEAWAVVDLSSSNGTRVGGTYVHRHRLADGDEVYAGKVRIVFHAAGFVSQRAQHPELPDAASPVLSELVTQSAALAPRPLPRVPVPVGARDAGEPGGLSDTAVFNAPSVAFERPAARPVIREPPEARERRLRMAAWLAALVAAVASAAAWAMWH